MKTSLSQVHKFPTVFFFSSRLTAVAGEYLLADSEALFGRENLASCLLEFDDNCAESAREYLASANFGNLIAQVGGPFSKVMTFVSVQVVDSNEFDILLEYDRTRFTKDSVGIFNISFGSHLAINAQSAEVSTLDSVLLSKGTVGQRAVNLKFSRSFVERGRKQLSEKYTNMFHSKYLDSQVPMILLAPFLSGTAPNKS